MILAPHLLLGAAIASKVQNPVLAIILALLSHYLLDFIPHIEYDIKNIKERRWRNAGAEVRNVLFDFLAGILLIFFSTNSGPLIYICAFVALIPDFLTFLNIALPNKILNLHDLMHRRKIHFLKNKKIPSFWRVSTQIITIVILLILLKF